MNRVLSNRIIFILAFAGFGIALYLTFVHFKALELVCGGSGGCEEVNIHYTSDGFGIPALKAIPTATFGAGMYLALMILSFLRVMSESEATARRVGVLITILSGLGVVVSAYLTYLEAYVIHAWCRWCVASAIIITLIFLAAFTERRAPVAERPKESLGEVIR